MTQTIHPRCAACGSKRQIIAGVCVYLCDEIVAGCLYWNARDKKLKVAKAWVLPYLKKYRTYDQLKSLREY